jgi:transporter family protein
LTFHLPPESPFTFNRNYLSRSSGIRSGVSGIQNISRTAMTFLILSGIATGLSWLAYFKALQIGKASQVAPIDKSSLVLTIIFAAVFLKEALTWKIVLGGILIIAGTLVLIL